MKQFAFILLFIIHNLLFAQKAKQLFTPNYDKKPFHFGFLLGINKADFIIHPIASLSSLDSVYKLESLAQSGFNLGIVADKRINEYADLRFIPALAFATRVLEYTFKSNQGTITRKKSIESTFINLPIDLKLKSARLNNFRAYLLSGLKYSIDIASQKDVNSDLVKDAIVKLRKNDFYYTAGIGFDFYRHYFKFSPELKFCFGLRNLLIKENNVFTNSIDRITSKIIDISFTFES